MRIEILFCYNGWILKIFTDENGKNPKKEESLVFQDLNDVFAEIKVRNVEFNENNA